MENEIINFENKNFKKSKLISLFESIYEHSDWVIKNVIGDKSNIPNTINELRSAMKKVVNTSSDNLKLKLLRAHPELGIKKNQLSSLTESSQEEKKSAVEDCPRVSQKKICTLLLLLLLLVLLMLRPATDAANALQHDQRTPRRCHRHPASESRWTGAHEQGRR